jgi:hypothetical protein
MALKKILCFLFLSGSTAFLTAQETVGSLDTVNEPFVAEKPAADAVQEQEPMPAEEPAVIAPEPRAAHEPAGKVKQSSVIEVNAGIGASISAAGNPSQVSDKLAMKENYIANVADKRGLPFGVSGFANFGYRVTPNHKTGLEFAMGYSTDGGTATVTMGDKLPGYAVDGSPLPGMVNQIMKVYPGMITKNTMRGHFIDPKLRAFYRYDSNKMLSVQAGLGAGLIIPFSYYAYPSRNPDDVISDNAGTIISSQGALRPTAVPFPLVMTDGTTMMHAFQPVMDFNIRIGLGSIFYFEGTYATEFQYIHNVKLILGLQSKGLGSNK